MAPSRRLLAPIRFGLVYAALYAATGVTAPFMAVWLKSRGFSGAEIGLVLALPLLARVASGPLLAHWADRFRLRRTPIFVLSLASAAAAALLLLARGPASVAGLWFLSATALGACTPLVDVVVLRSAPVEGFAYAQARGVGSAAYVAGNILGGALLARLGPDVVVVWCVAAALAAAVLALASLPPTPVRGASGPRPSRPLRDLLANAPFICAIAAAGLIQASHAFYYSFSTLLWRAQGLQAGVVGLLWGTGVAVEVVFLVFGEDLRRRIGPVRLLLFGGLGAVVRWTAFAASPPLILLFPLQALHALSFTSTFVASLQLVDRLCPAESASSAQSLNAALYSGLLIGGATLASGPLFEALGVRGYLAMAALALAGLLVALGLEPLIRRTSDFRPYPQSSGAGG